jgi:poly(hydroxyalkanoate) granule-associated protein
MTLTMGGNRRRGVPMAARRKQSTAQSRARKARSGVSGSQAALIENVQQIWLAGMGAIAKAQKEGPSAFTDAVAEGLKLLDRSRSNAEQAIRDAFEVAQESVQTRFGSARDQAAETWDNLEALFQSRVQKALNQIGVPSADEIRILTRRVAELNGSVQALSAKQVSARRAAAKRTAAKAAGKRRARARTTR